MNFNNAINPKKDSAYPTKDSAYPTVLMPARSDKIKKVVARDNQGGIGGATELNSGTVYIPTGDNANERTIRYHEAMHASHTPKKSNPKDLLDQALEDGRLHRYCSKSAESAYQQARRDEVSTALRELRKIDRQFSEMKPLNASVVAFRSFSILAASKIKPAHQTLLTSALSRLGEHTPKHFQKALDLLGAGKWEDARKALAKYFAKDFDPTKPPVIKTKSKDVKPKSVKTDSSKDESEKAKHSESGKDVDSSGDESEDKDEETDESEEEEEEEEDSSEESDEEETEDEEEESPEIAPLDMSSSTESTDKKAKKVHKDAYVADLTPSCDEETYKTMFVSHPMELLIKRLDMDINRVRLSLGRKAQLPVASGRKILARKLAGATVNPTMRVFARPVSSGGWGTVLIDASGSMQIPEETLISFLKACPALTLGFYNAPNDNYRSTKHGSIFIYAANGYRASCTNLRLAEGYGPGNLIDYQAIAWLLKQPSPHYLVTDMQFTGPWEGPAKELCKKLVFAKQLRVVRNLQIMQTILGEKGKTL